MTRARATTRSSVAAGGRATTARPKGQLGIVLVAAEVAPYSGEGNVAHAVDALADGLVRRGHLVSVYSPAYGEGQQGPSKLGVVLGRVEVEVDDRTETASFHRLRRHGADYWFVNHDGYFDRVGLYGAGEERFVDNAERFSFFVRAVLRHLANGDPAPDVIHCHDWPTALLPVYLKAGFADRLQPSPATVLSVNDLARQGRFDEAAFHDLGLAREQLEPGRLGFHGRISLLQGGLRAADLVTLPSPRFAREVRTEEFGCGLEGVIETRGDAVRGIIGGIPAAMWNADSDRFLKARYDSEEMVGKRSCKLDLQTDLGLKRDVDATVLAVAGPLDMDRGADLLLDALPEILAGNTQLAVVAAGERAYLKRLETLRASRPTQIGIETNVTELRVHKLRAGADMLLLPHRKEAGGLEALLALRYGTIPVARRVGALDDVIDDVADRPPGSATGFKFEAATAPALAKRVLAGIAMHQTRPDDWQVLVVNAMAVDLSWAAVAARFEAAYRDAVRLRDRGSVPQPLWNSPRLT